MSGIGLPKGMSRDDAYVQGMADAEERAALTRRTLAVKSGMCPGSWLEMDQNQPNTTLRLRPRPCAECGMSVSPVFDQSDAAFYAAHTINIKCRFCFSSYVTATGTAMVKCTYCGGVGRGIPLDRPIDY